MTPSRTHNTPTGIGNLTGKAVVAARERDEMNQLGDEGGVKYNRQPYRDYLGYEPATTAYELRDPSRWQPNNITTGNGIFRVQQFVTPQMRVTRPHSYSNSNRFNAPRPVKSNPNGPGGRQAYVQQADEVLAASANLTDEMKAAVELFDNKIRSLGFSVLFVMSPRRAVWASNSSSSWTSSPTWRPSTLPSPCGTKSISGTPFGPSAPIAIYLYGDRPVTAWGGPGKGKVTDLPASQWRSHINTADHPEYPSGPASPCSAHGQTARRFLGSDSLGWMVPVPKGTSVIEPGSLRRTTSCSVGPLGPTLNGTAVSAAYGEASTSCRR